MRGFGITIDLVASVAFADVAAVRCAAVVRVLWIARAGAAVLKASGDLAVATAVPAFNSDFHP